MTEQLKHLREALRRVKYEAASLADAQVIALEALTAAQPAQEVAAVNTREQTFQNGYRIGYQAGRASLPTQPAAQATPASADDMEVYDGMAADYFADARQAAPEPLFVKGAMSGMVDAQVRDLFPTKAAAQAKGGGHG